MTSPPTNTFETYAAVGNRDDLTDIIYNIDPTDTPGLSSFETTEATAVLHEWQTDALTAASHTFKFQWRVGNAAHTATLYGSAGAGMYARFWAVEVY